AIIILYRRTGEADGRATPKSPRVRRPGEDHFADGCWRVPSKSGSGWYTVILDDRDAACDCADFDLRGNPKALDAVLADIDLQAGSGSYYDGRLREGAWPWSVEGERPSLTPFRVEWRKDNGKQQEG